MNDQCFGIDYLRVTVHAPLRICEWLYEETFQIYLGELTDCMHGAKGFGRVKEALHGFQLKYSPNSAKEYCSFELPGNVCMVIPPEILKGFQEILIDNGIIYNITRIDLAFDRVPFTPDQFRQAIEDDVNRKKFEKPVVRSLAQRESVRWESQLMRLRDDGSGYGRDTCYFGSRTSERFLRVYNKRGPTRLEIELKGKRARTIGMIILSAPI